MGGNSGAGQRQSLSRRTVVAGAAWAVPAVAIAPAAVAASCSKICVSYQGVACKSPGNSDPLNKKAYKYLFQWENASGGVPPYNGCMMVFFYSFTVNGTPAPDYMHITPYNSGPVGSCSCGSCDPRTSTVLNAIKALDPAYVIPANPTTYYSGTQTGNTAATPPYVCIADGSTLQGVVTGGEYQDSENGLNTVIKWAVIDPATCTVKYVESVTIGATPPQCPPGV